MDNRARIISVNPAVMTAGERNIAAGILPDGIRTMTGDAADAGMADAGNEVASAPECLPRTHHFYDHSSLEMRAISAIRRRLKMFFGVSGSASGLTAPADSISFSLRLLFGMFLIVYGLFAGISAESMIMISTGVLMLGGLFSRLASAVLFVAEVAFAGMAYASGFDWYINAAIAAGALAGTVLGPGHLSLDAWLQNIIQHAIIRNMIFRARALRGSYRAYASTL